ncbi:patatin-like phospholipase family protein [Paenibacillus larvae]|uniref:Patatin-like phospholipase family protein n=2 Tax=Paenibacillus larvae TaxID=1464 RepID=A0AAP5N0T9_9BACL|nr:patatin-like phospholipase family protein [Paenibacillus larvae]AQR76121.1 patatin [Paenibacillus larvae subsp. larvae]AVF23130.1 Patatin [Paenibacillus larvae subsp. larvae]ETK26195.1 hypothetical protein ERIC1_2c03930 [Paenibacillus larvae subsp. larvae DSM 25719]MCY7477099.1 patatin-like phospholipase family protein [Paenibacillus larvae]MCY7488251.1 patatin-like phospholipase family protein [Paenibacillus larvae]
MKINGVFEGGGVKGIALAGAVSAVMDKGITFHQVAGTSSGSIVASFLAAGYTGSEMKQLILESPFRSFLKRAPVFNVKIIGPAFRLLLKKGLYSGEMLEDWVHRKLAAKNIRTFGDLKRNQLRIIASDISQGKLLVLPDDVRQYGLDPKKFPISKAVRMSTSIPYFLDPVLIRKSSKIGSKLPLSEQFVHIVDGGVLSNFPLWLFDEERSTTNPQPTIGFSLVGRIPNQVHKISGPISMFQALFSTMMDAHDERYIEEHNRFRTIKIPAMGVGATEFSISQEKSEALYKTGYQASQSFFRNWSDQNYENEYEKHVLRKLK